MSPPKDPEKYALWVERNRAAKLGKKLGPQSPEHRAKLSASNRGQKRSEETRQRLRESHLGKTLSEEAKDKLRALRKEKANGWKGSDITYAGAHKRLERYWGKERSCLACGKSEGRIQAALRHDASEVIVQGKQRFSPHIEDYVPLCGVCHNAYDRGVSARCLEIQARVRELVEAQERVAS